MKANLYPGRGTWPDWNNLDVQQIGRMPAHAYRVPFPDLSSCRHAVNDNRRYISPYIFNLNSGWECRRYADILQLPESILSFRSGFDPMAVPGGLAILPAAQEGRIGYPFPVTPPWVPSEMPVLVCRRTCRLPLTWGGIRKKLVLQGVSSACHVFVNGKLTGYTQGCCLPAEFDITVHLHDGDNELFILIYPFCDGSYLEKQPVSLMTGLIRDIWIEAVPAISIDDVRIRTTPLSDEGDWQIDLEVTLISYRIAMDSPSLRVSLWHGDVNIHDTAWAVRLKQSEDHDYVSPVQAVGRLTVRIALNGIQAWNDELPELYDLYLSVEERGGHELSCIHQPVGFRTVTSRDGVIWLNNKPVQLRAVICPAESLTDSRVMVTLLRRLRQSHLNAIYIKDYPADPILLELCDIYGVLVIDEAPLDIAHPHLMDVIREDPRWLKAAADRLERLIIRDFNHPCVVLWSAGLFRQASPLTLQLTEKIRSIDSGRPVHLIDTGDICAGLAEYENNGYSEIYENFWLNQFSVPGQCYFVWGRQDALMLNELRQLLHALEITAIDAVNGAFLVKNNHHWLAADNYRFDWLLLRNGRFILTGEIDNIRCGPGDEQFIELLFGDLAFDDGAEYLLRFEVTYAKSGLWADCGEEAFFQEFVLTAAERPDLEAPGQNNGRLRLESDRHHLIVSGGRFWMVFNRINGSLESWRMGDRELMAANMSPGHIQPGLQTTLWRKTDFLDQPMLPEWRQAGYDRLIPQVMTSQEGCDGHTAVIEMMIRLAAAGKTASYELIMRYEIRTAGDLRVFSSIRPLLDSMPKLPCFGLTLHLSRAFDQISWFGGGPGPGMASLHHSPRRGLYQGNKIDRELGVRLPGHSPGIYPGIEWLSLKDKTGFGLSIRCSQLFGFAISPADQSDLWTGFSEMKSDRQALSVQLFARTKPFNLDQPLKSIWHIRPE